MSDLVRDIEGVLIDICGRILDSKRRNTAMEDFQYKLCLRLADGRFMNKDFDELIDRIMKCLPEYEETVLRGAYIEHDFERNLGEIFDVYIAHVASSNSQYVDQMDNRDYALFEDAMNSLTHEVFFGPTRQRASRAYAGRDTGYRDDRRPSYDDRAPRGRGRYDDRDPVGRRGYDDRRPTYDDRAPAGRGRSPYNEQRQQRRGSVTGDMDPYSAMSQLQAPERDVPVADPVDTPQYRQAGQVHRRDPRAQPDIYDEREPQVLTRRIAPGPESIMGNDLVQVDPRFIPPVNQGYDYTKERPFEDFWEDDRHWQAVSITEWTLNGPGHESIPFIYDLNTEVAYYVRDRSGRVTMETKPMTEDTRYLNQSMYYDPAKQEDPYRRHAPSLAQILDTSEEHADFDTVKQTGPRTIGDVLSIDLDTYGDSASQISYNLMTSAIEARKNMEPGQSHATITELVLLKPLELMNAEQANLLKGLMDEKTLTGLATALENIRGKIPNAAWEFVTNRISAEIQDTVTRLFSIPSKGFKFPDNWDAMIKYVAGRQHEVGAPGSNWDIDTQVFARSMNTLVAPLVVYLDHTDEDGNVSSAMSEFVTPINANRVVPYFDHVALITVPQSLDEINLGSQIETSGHAIISATSDSSSAQVLHNLVHEVLGKYKKLPISHLLISTGCGRMIRIRRYAMSGPVMVLTMFRP